MDVKSDQEKSKNENIIFNLQSFIRKEMNKYEDILSVILFGSYATNNFNEESDIDLCIVFKEDVERDIEDTIFNQLLDFEKIIDKTIQCVFIYPEDIQRWDRIFIENILAEGNLLFGNINFDKKLMEVLELEPFLIITFILKNLQNSEKMKLKRILYGYKSVKQYSNKIYTYNKEGLVQKLKGRKLGRGSFIIPEKDIAIIEKQFKDYSCNYNKLRVWLQVV